MPEQLLFKEVLDQYGVPFIAYEEVAGHYNDQGDWVPGGQPISVEMTGVFLPFSDDELRYAENGTYSIRDRKIITTHFLSEGQKVQYRDITYTIQGYKDLSEYTDVNTYIARWAGNENSGS